MAHAPRGRGSIGSHLLSFATGFSIAGVGGYYQFRGEFNRIASEFTEELGEISRDILQIQESYKNVSSRLDVLEHRGDKEITESKLQISNEEEAYLLDDEKVIDV